LKFSHDCMTNSEWGFKRPKEFMGAKASVKLVLLNLVMQFVGLRRDSPELFGG